MAHFATKAFVFGGVSLASSLVFLCIIPFAELAFFTNNRDPSATEPAVVLGGVSLTLAGIGVASILFVGIPLTVLADRAARVSFQASPTGGSVRVAF